jgi:hypothetical protein
MNEYNHSEDFFEKRISGIEGYSDDTIFEDNRVEEMQDWLSTVYAAIQDSNSPRYGETELREMTEEDKERFKESFQQSAGLDEMGAEFRLALTSGGYFIDEDEYVMPESLMISNGISDGEKGTIAHEAGHRLGYKIEDKRLQPLMDAHDFSEDTQHFNEDSFSDLLSFRFYLESEHFAERVKAAIANEFDENFEYDEEKIKRREEEDGSIVHEVYENFIDYDRDEDLDELVENISREIRSIVDLEQ